MKKTSSCDFHGQTVKNASIIRIIRSADIEEDDYSLQEHEDYREMMETLIKQRRKLAPLRMEMSPRSRRDRSGYVETFLGSF